MFTFRVCVLLLLALAFAACRGEGEWRKIDPEPITGHYRHKPGIGRQLAYRIAGQANTVCTVAWHELVSRTHVTVLVNAFAEKETGKKYWFAFTMREGTFDSVASYTEMGRDVFTADCGSVLARLPDHAVREAFKEAYRAPIPTAVDHYF